MEKYPSVINLETGEDITDQVIKPVRKKTMMELKLEEARVRRIKNKKRKKRKKR